MNLSKTKKLLEKCQPARLCLSFANHLHMFRENDDKILYEQLVKELNKKGKGEPKMKSLRSLANVLDASGVMNTTDDGLLPIVPYKTVKDLLTQYPCNDKDLMSAEAIVWRAFMEKGPNAMDFLKGGEGILNYERRCQKPIIPVIATDIETQCKKIMEQHKLTGKLIIYDIGCGDGAIAIELAKKMKNATIYAYDPNPIAIIKANADKPKELKNLTFSDKPWPTDGDVHVVLCINVLHDIEHTDLFLQMIREKLHHIGIAMIVDPTVSIHKERNLFNPQVVEALALGSIGCVHSNDCIHAMGPGIGKERLLQYIERNGLHVTRDMLLANSLFYHSFIVEKTVSEESKKFLFEIGKYLKQQ